MQRIIWGIDIGGTKTEFAPVNINQGALIIDQPYHFSTADMKNGEELVAELKKVIPANDLVGASVAGKITGTHAYNDNFPFKTVDLSPLNAKVANDLEGSSYAVEPYMVQRNINRWSIWTISTGANAHTVHDGVHISHELAYEDYPGPSPMILPFKCPSKIEPAICAPGAKAMAVDYFLNKGEKTPILHHPLLFQAYQAYLAKKNGATNSTISQQATVKDFPGVLEHLESSMIYELARLGNRITPIGEIVDVQQDALAYAINRHVSTFVGLEAIIFMGSQGINDFETQVIPARDKAIQMKQYRHPALDVPTVEKLQIKYPGIIGGALFCDKQI